MPDSDVDEQIRTFRRKLDRELGIPEGKTFEDWLNQVFRNPTSEQPIELSEFLSHLDVRSFLKVFERIYPRFRIIEQRLSPRLKFALFLAGKGCGRVTEGHRLLKDERTRRNLGFKEEPTYEVLREFINEKLPLVMDELCMVVLVELKRELERNGLPAFKHLANDATDLRARKTDKEAEFSGYYKEYGYKEDIVLDMDNYIPARWTNTGINYCEGYCLPCHLEALAQLGIHPETLTVDGKYSTYENIAKAHIRYGVRLIYKILDDWVWNPKGELPEIKHRYQTYRNEPGFKPDAEVREMLGLLFKMGDSEHVGAYFRNDAMTRYRENPEKYLAEYHRRNTIEGHNNRIKNETHMEKNVPKGQKKVAHHASLCLLFLQMVALNRLQHGVKGNLGSVVHLT
jgi:hypothetical protein